MSDMKGSITLGLSCIILINTLIILYVTQGRKIGNTDKNEENIETYYNEQFIYETVQNNGLSAHITEIQDRMNTEQPVLACYYSSYSCNICVDFAVEKIQEFFPDVETNPRLLFITSNFSKKMNFYKFEKEINLGKSKLGLPIEQTTLPFYFVLLNGTVQHIFIPEKSLPTYTNIYLKGIKKRYFSQ